MSGSGGRLRAFRDAVLGVIAGLPPTAFSIVMATGIVSTAAELLDLHFVALTLLALNLAMYGLLVLLLAARLFAYWQRARDDLHDHARAPGYFTIVAGTCVLGSQFVAVVDYRPAAIGLWILGATLWVVLGYAFFAVMTTQRTKPRLDHGLNGTWMLITVATQSVSLLGTLLAPALGGGRGTEIVLAGTLGLFLLGCLFYLLLFGLVLIRFLFFRLTAAELTPPYWINMGAVAITTLAGSLLIVRAESWSSLQEILPFLKGFTLLFWATATWWIPLLLILGAWRHVGQRVPLRYNLQNWSIVFPLGMYSVATFRLIEAVGWDFLLPVAYGVGYTALLVWTLTLAGLARRLPHSSVEPS